MKKAFIIFVILLASPSIISEEVSNDLEVQVKPARVVQHVELAEIDDVKFSLLVEDLGGSTDLSPTQKIYFTMYKKGEMFNTDATFNLGHIFLLESAKDIEGHEGCFLLKVKNLGGKYNAEILEETFIIDAREALKDILAIDCGSEFDCELTVRFQTRIGFLRN